VTTYAIIRFYYVQYYRYVLLQTFIQLKQVPIARVACSLLLVDRDFANREFRKCAEASGPSAVGNVQRILIVTDDMSQIAHYSLWTLVKSSALHRE
jgi:hypothetical protein